jgi:hypothetical protein
VYLRSTPNKTLQILVVKVTVVKVVVVELDQFLVVLGQ